MKSKSSLVKKRQAKDKLLANEKQARELAELLRPVLERAHNLSKFTKSAFDLVEEIQLSMAWRALRHWYRKDRRYIESLERKLKDANALADELIIQNRQLEYRIETLDRIADSATRLLNKEQNETKN